MQNDLLQLFQPFGVITKLVMLRAKNQVFFFIPLSETDSSCINLRLFQFIIFCTTCAIFVGSSPNARCAFCSQCFTILCKYPAKYKVQMACLFLSFEDVHDCIDCSFIIRFFVLYQYIPFDNKATLAIELSFCFVLGGGMFMFSFPHIKN